jgi:hypothetical protein
MVFADIPSELTEETFRWGKYHAMAQSATVTALISGPLGKIPGARGSSQDSVIFQDYHIKLR